MRRPPRTRLLAASVALIATFGVAACGSDDDDDTTATDPTTLDSTAATSSEDTSDVTLPVEDTSGSTPSDGTGGGEVGTQEEYVDAAKGEVDFSDEAINDCVATAIVNDDVYAAIQDAGLTVEQFREDGPIGLGVDESVASQIASEFAACGELLPEVLTDEAQLACAEDNLTNDQMAEYLAYTLLGLDPSDEVTAANEAVDTCINESDTTTTG